MMLQILFPVTILLLQVWRGNADDYQSCGRRSIDRNLIGRVIGGYPASFGEVPWQASIQESRLFGLINYRKCGAVVIHRNWLLTAAHCNARWAFSGLFVTTGEHDTRPQDNHKNKKKPQQTKNDKKSKDDPDKILKAANRTRYVTQKRKVKRIISHPMFSPLDLEDDIALIELDQPLDFGPSVQPICLPNKDADFSRKQGIVSGWGMTKYRSGPLPSVLQVVNLPIISNEKCRQMFTTAGVRKRIPSTVVCAGYAEGGKDSCEGDSGGPLMVWSEESSNWILAGVVSNGIRCAEPNLPGIYTRISRYVDWINKYVRW